MRGMETERERGGGEGGRERREKEVHVEEHINSWVIDHKNACTLTCPSLPLAPLCNSPATCLIDALSNEISRKCCFKCPLVLKWIVTLSIRHTVGEGSRDVHMDREEEEVKEYF